MVPDIKAVFVEAFLHIVVWAVALDSLLFVGMAQSAEGTIWGLVDTDVADLQAESPYIVLAHNIEAV